MSALDLNEYKEKQLRLFAETKAELLQKSELDPGTVREVRLSMLGLATAIADTLPDPQMNVHVEYAIQQTLEKVLEWRKNPRVLAACFALAQLELASELFTQFATKYGLKWYFMWESTRRGLIGKIGDVLYTLRTHCGTYDEKNWLSLFSEDDLKGREFTLPKPLVAKDAKATQKELDLYSPLLVEYYNQFLAVLKLPKEAPQLAAAPAEAEA
jgi:hypothetical protein